MTLQNKKTIQMRTVDETHACTHAQRDKVNKMPTSTCISAKRNKVPTLLCKSKRRLIRVETRNTMSAASYFGCDCAVEAAAAADANANASPRGARTEGPDTYRRVDVISSRQSSAEYRLINTET